MPTSEFEFPSAVPLKYLWLALTTWPLLSTHFLEEKEAKKERETERDRERQRQRQRERERDDTHQHRKNLAEKLEYLLQ